MPWEKKFDHTEVLEKAARAFWARGYEATSMADLVAATGINRGSIYSTFTDKRGLFRRALQHYDDIYRSRFLAKLAMDYPPREAIVAAFRSAATMMPDRPAGCLVVNSALELAPHDAEIADDLRDSMAGLRRFLADRLLAAAAMQAIPQERAETGTVEHLFALFMGVRVITRAGLDAGRIVKEVADMLD